MRREYVDSSGYRISTLLNCMPADMQRVLVDHMPEPFRLVLSEVNFNIAVKFKRHTINGPDYKLAIYAIEQDYVQLLKWLVSRDVYISDHTLNCCIVHNAVKSFRYLWKYLRTGVNFELCVIEGYLRPCLAQHHFELADIVYTSMPISDNPSNLYNYDHRDDPPAIRWLYGKGLIPSSNSIKRYLSKGYYGNLRTLFEMGYRFDRFIEQCLPITTQEPDDELCKLLDYLSDNNIEKCTPELLTAAIYWNNHIMFKYMLSRGLKLSEDNIIMVCKLYNRNVVTVMLDFGYNPLCIPAVYRECSPWAVENIREIMKSRQKLIVMGNWVIRNKIDLPTQ
jgi:hypothetical protein